MRRLVLAVAAVLLLCTPVRAQSQYELSQQAAQAFHSADRELNEVYRQVQAKLDAQQKDALTNAQLLWIRFRDADADAQAMLYQGGTMAPMVHDYAAAESTRLRTRQLRDFLKTLQEH